MGFFDRGVRGFKLKHSEDPKNIARIPKRYPEENILRKPLPHATMAQSLSLNSPLLCLKRPHVKMGTYTFFSTGSTWVEIHIRMRNNCFASCRVANFTTWPRLSSTCPAFHAVWQNSVLLVGSNLPSGRPEENTQRKP